MSVKSRNSPETWVDPDDATELTDEFFKNGVWRIGDKIVSREEARAESIRRHGSVIGPGNMVSTTIKVDADVLAAFKATGEGWQLRINDVLKEWLKCN